MKKKISKDGAIELLKLGWQLRRDIPYGKTYVVVFVNDSLKYYTSLVRMIKSMLNLSFKFTVNGILIKEVSISVENPDFILNHDDIGKDFKEWLENYLNV